MWAVIESVHQGLLLVRLDDPTSCTVPAAEREMCMDECLFNEDLPCDKDVYELCRICMNERHWTMPLNAYSAIELYESLRHAILSWLD